MKLRPRIVLSILLTVIPFAVGMAFWQLSNHRQNTYENMAQNARNMMSRTQNFCLENPREWPPGPKDRASAPPAEFFAYGSDYRSLNPNAPQLDSTLIKSMKKGDSFAGTKITRFGGKRNAVLARTTRNNGPCSFVLITVSAPANDTGKTHALLTGLASGLLAMVVALFAVAPIVSRVGRLQKAVKSEDTEALLMEGNDEITELGCAFARAQEQIAARLEERKEMEYALRDYITHTTHDILTPLTVLQGNLTTLKKSFSKENLAEQKAMSNAILGCEHIGALVANLSVVAKLAATSVPSEHLPTSLNQVIERVCARYIPFAKLRLIDLNYSVPDTEVMVNGDMVLMERAFGNLIHNAIRYNQDGGHVAVVLASSNSSFSLKVFDDGPGVSHNEVQRISEKGYVGVEGKAAGGSGIGLYVVKNVVEHHGWSIIFSQCDPRGFEVEICGEDVSTS